MITYNSYFIFIQVKSDIHGVLIRHKARVPEVIEMTTQRTVENPSIVVNAKRQDKTCKKRTRTLNYLLLNAVDETLKQVFKEAGTEVVYNFIENKCHFKCKEIAEKPEVFSADLKRLLVSATPMIEKMILKNLYSKLELQFVDKEGYEFSDYIDQLREK
jgi:rRNA maturation protein Rpf1